MRLMIGAVVGFKCFAWLHYMTKLKHVAINLELEVTWSSSLFMNLNWRLMLESRPCGILIKLKKNVKTCPPKSCSDLQYSRTSFEGAFVDNEILIKFKKNYHWSIHYLYGLFLLSMAMRHASLELGYSGANYVSTHVKIKCFSQLKLSRHYYQSNYAMSHVKEIIFKVI